MDNHNIKLEDVLFDKFIEVTDTGYASSVVEKTFKKSKSTPIIKVSFYNLLQTASIVNGVTIVDKRILKIFNNNYNLIVKEIPHIAFDINFYIITNKNKTNKEYITKCVEKIINIGQQYI